MGPYERRAFPLTLRSDGATSARIIGHAAVFESDSEEMGWFLPYRERIARMAFDDALGRVASGQDDVYALLNHDENYVISATADHTLTLSVDERGLLAEMEPMDTQTIRDLVLTPMRQGKIRKMSFGFSVSDEHEEKRNGVLYRIIDKIGRLFDVSPVLFPAYPATDVMTRRLRLFGVDAAHLDIRSGSVARAFLDTFRDAHDYEDCPDDDCPMKRKLPTVDGKAASILVARPVAAGAAMTRLRELELHLSDFDFIQGDPRK